jgi:hypothetical protein
MKTDRRNPLGKMLECKLAQVCIFEPGVSWCTYDVLGLHLVVGTSECTYCNIDASTEVQAS